jgi:hypothetical protein
MGTNRRPLKRQKLPNITPEAVQAFRDSNAMALHLALGLEPCEMSPLIVHWRPKPDLNNCIDHAWLNSWEKAMILRQRLIAAVGLPNHEHHYEEHPADELADVRSEIERLEAREAELRSYLLQHPDDRAGG